MIKSILDSNVAFSGWIPALFTMLVGLIWGRYKICTKSKVTQTQKSGNNSKQKQSVGENIIKDKNKIEQFQEAGDNSEQIQELK